MSALTPPAGTMFFFWTTIVFRCLAISARWHGFFVRKGEAGCAGVVSAYRRTVLDRQRFSEFFPGYDQGEDLEMSRRIAKDGKLLWCGDAHVRHLPGTSGRPDWFQRGRMETTNRYFIWRRHSPHPELSDRLRFWADIFYSAACDAVGFVSKPRRGSTLRHA